MSNVYPVIAYTGRKFPENIILLIRIPIDISHNLYNLFIHFSYLTNNLP
jgi:hypothetical protein